MMSTSIPSLTDTSLVNQTYSVSLQKLSPSTVYYIRVVAVYDVIIARYSEQTSFRTYDEGLYNIHFDIAYYVTCDCVYSTEQFVYLPFLNHSDTNINSGNLDPCDDCSSVQIVFPYDLPFGGAFHRSAYVSWLCRHLIQLCKRSLCAYTRIQSLVWYVLCVGGLHCLTPLPYPLTICKYLIHAYQVIAEV